MQGSRWCVCPFWQVNNSLDLVYMWMLDLLLIQAWIRRSWICLFWLNNDNRWPFIWRDAVYNDKDSLLKISCLFLLILVSSHGLSSGEIFVEQVLAKWKTNIWQWAQQVERLLSSLSTEKSVTLSNDECEKTECMVTAREMCEFVGLLPLAASQ